MKPARRASRGLGRTRKGAGGKWAPFRRQLEALHRRLVEERREHQASAAQPLDLLGASPAESATDEFERDLNLTEISAAQDLLYEVEAALRRIEAGTFGRCELTGRLIPRDRLRAVPWARFSKSAEELQEAAGGARRIRLGEVRTVRGPRGEAIEEITEEAARPEAPSSSPGTLRVLIGRERKSPGTRRRRERKA